MIGPMVGESKILVSIPSERLFPTRHDFSLDARFSISDLLNLHSHRFFPTDSDRFGGIGFLFSSLSGGQQYLGCSRVKEASMWEHGDDGRK